MLVNEDVSDIVYHELSGLDRYMAWLENSFLLDITDQKLLSQHFEWTDRISASVPTFTLDYPRDYGMLPEVQRTIRNHVESLSN